MNKLKVSLIVTGFPSEDNPSHGIFNKRAADLLSEHVDITVLHLRVWKPGRKFVKLMAELPYKHYTIAAPYLPPGNNVFICRLIRIYAFIMRSMLKEVLQATDVFHSVGVSFSGAIGTLLAGKLGKIHVIQVTGTDVNTELPGLLHLSCFNLIHRNTNGVGCNSLALKRQYERLFGEFENIEVIYRGINTKKYDYCFDDFSNGKVRFLFLGGIPDYKHLESGKNLKGGMILMNAWKSNEEELVTLNCELIFAGPGSDSETAKRWHRSLTNQNSVFLKGALNPVEVMEEYNRSHVVLIPSLEEGMPNVALEAGATGKCVIASNVGGLPELIDNDNTGFLINPGDEGGLANAILYCAKNRSRIKETGKKLHEEIHKNFNSDSFAPGYLKLYKKALENLER